ncbi:Tn3 family transposase [Phenylobacterium sp. LjRoot225]|uniref:Tn3 family transposase n=1 Tax=Phenylobacterium sp. LjRoot225 TaxID=3342285 RepID=UPI003F4FF08D
MALWNTLYMDRAVEHLRSREVSVPDHLLAHLSPMGWAHISLTGDYIWAAADAGDGRGDRQDAFRPLRSAPKANYSRREFMVCPLMRQNWAVR